MAEIVAKRLAEHLERAGFVVMKRPPEIGGAALGAVSRDNNGAAEDTVPPGWGRDELTKAWDHARANQLGTFANRRGAYKRIAAIDRAFATILQGSANPGNELATMLFLLPLRLSRRGWISPRPGMRSSPSSLDRAALDRSLATRFTSFGI